MDAAISSSVFSLELRVHVSCQGDGSCLGECTYLGHCMTFGALGTVFGFTCTPHRFTCHKSAILSRRNKTPLCISQFPREPECSYFPLSAIVKRNISISCAWGVLSSIYVGPEIRLWACGGHQGTLNTLILMHFTLLWVCNLHYTWCLHLKIPPPVIEKIFSNVEVFDLVFSKCIHTLLM